MYDRTPPTADSVTLTPSTVDVTGQPARVTARVHVVDDTGVTQVQLNAAENVESSTRATLTPMLLSLASGTVRDGWWEGSVLVSRWTPTAKLAAHASVRDRVSRVGYYTVPNALTVINHDPDEQLPAVAELTLSSPTGSFPLDVRTASSSVTVRAHLTDEQSGLTVAPRACLAYPFEGDYRGAGCRVLQLTSGTRHDGWWRATLPVAQGAVAGDWNVSVLAPDEAHPDAQLRWLGPDQYALETRRSSAAQLADRARPLPAGAGRFSVLGVGDYTAPELSRTTISPSSVDSLAGPARVGVDIRATDVEGVTAVGAWLESSTNDGSGPQFMWVKAEQPTSGTRTDGIWHLDLTVPQGTPPGSYPVMVWAEDSTHTRMWVPPTSPQVGVNPDVNVMTPEQMSGSDGTVTVLERS